MFEGLRNMRAVQHTHQHCSGAGSRVEKSEPTEGVTQGVQPANERAEDREQRPPPPAAWGAGLADVRRPEGVRREAHGEEQMVAAQQLEAQPQVIDINKITRA
ncbi:hypothetical protein GGF50DRAFT_127714 [Schizophyllum commune]